MATNVKKSVLITIIIPTIDGRQKYLRSAIQSCLNQDDGNINVIVSDNSSRNSEDLVKGYQDSRLKYISPESYLPMSRHWDYALSKVDNGYVCFIGDDDVLMPDCVKKLRRIIEIYPGVPVMHALANYFWTDFGNQHLRNKSAFFHDVDGKIALIETNSFIDGVLNGAVRYVDGPMVYHNFIPVSLLKKAIGQEFFFIRSSPDVYSSIAIALNCNKFVVTGSLLTLSGQGAQANGQSVKANGNVGKSFLEDAKKYYPPRFLSKTISLALLDSLLEAISAYDKAHLAGKINYNQYLFNALTELDSINGARNWLSELAAIFSVLIKSGNKFSFIYNITRKIFSKILRRLFFGKACLNSYEKFKQGYTYSHSVSVLDALGASQELEEEIRGGGIDENCL